MSNGPLLGWPVLAAARRFAPLRFSALLALVVSAAACEDSDSNGPPTFFVEEVGLKVPRLSGWVPDPELEVGDLTEGGTALRLVRENAAPGSPKISVELSSKGTGTTLAAFLNQNLRTMGDLESQSGGNMRITRVKQNQIRVGQRRAHLVSHEFTMGKGELALAFTQHSALLVVDGRGIAIIAVGRDELFRPLADQIHRVLTGLQITVDPDNAQGQGAKAIELQEVKPVDLGTIGGK